MSSPKLSTKPCPICHLMVDIIGVDNKGKKIASCGHVFKFRRTKSQKDMDRKYITTPYGLEKVK